MRWCWWWLGWSGCVAATTKDTEHSGDSPAGACALAEVSETCPSCSDGPWTCSYGPSSVTRGSCGECQVRAALYQALCDAGEGSSAEEIEAGAVCGPATCEVSYGCSCTPSCVLGGPAFGTTSSDTAADPCTPCATPEDPPGPCAWNGAECAFP